MSMIKKSLVVILLGLLLAGCADKPPTDMNNICSIFAQKRDWFKAALKAQKRWNVPLEVSMAFIYQESAFKYDAMPPREYILGFIPWGRVSSSYGFAQAEDATWKQYIKATGDSWANRASFADSIDFISWYIDQAVKQDGISKSDAYDLYLAYHEGIGGYAEKTYEKKPYLIAVANRVQSIATLYTKQYQSCKQSLMEPHGFFEYIFGI